MKPYTVKRPVNYGKAVEDVKLYQAGDPIELEDADAKPLLDCGAIEPADPKEKFQDAVAKAEAAARELELSGGDPSAAARELQQRRQDDARTLDEVVDGVAQAVRLGATTAADAATQICEQLKTVEHADVLDRIVARVSAMNTESEFSPQQRDHQDAGDAAREAAKPPATKEAKKRK